MKTKSILTNGVVLLMGSDSGLQHRMRAALEADSFQVFLAAGHKETLELFDASSIDILLIEPDCEPESLCRLVAQLKTRCPRLRIIGILREQNEAAKAHVDGVNVWMEKPLSIKRLAATVNDLLAEIRAEIFRNELLLRQTTRFASSAPYVRWGLNE